ncbi:23S rRNA (pseudouridine(1915)-N(3))-methyltransferase RlmH, partial [Acinetobacter baumannii]
RPGPAKALFDDYAGRLTWPVTVREVEVRKRLDGDSLRRQEAELLLAAVPAGATLLVLDERGQTLASNGFARRLGQWRDGGVADLAVLIGGADGH